MWTNIIKGQIICTLDAQIQKKNDKVFGIFSSLMLQQPKFYMEYKSFNMFERVSTVEHACEVWLSLTKVLVLRKVSLF